MVLLNPATPTDGSAHPLPSGRDHGAADEVVARAVAKGVAKSVVLELLDDAPEPWWESTSASGLATDIVLLAPTLGPGEVRIRIVSGMSDWELSVIAADRAIDAR